MRWVREAAPNPSPWRRIRGSFCYDELPVKPRVTVPQIAAVLDGMLKHLGVAPSAVAVQPTGRTLVQLDTIFYADTPPTFDKSVTLLGTPVTVHLTPREWTWHWGDGKSDTTSSPGHAYPDQDVTHRYRAVGQRIVSVDVTWGGTFTALGQTRTITGTVTIGGVPATLSVQEARARLVG